MSTQVPREVQPMIDAAERLHLERAWVVECSRCANEDTSFATQMHEARGDFIESGWTADEDDFQYCPACSS